MLIGDDDDDILEETDAALLDDAAEEEEPGSDASASEAVGDSIEIDKLSAADFDLLPFVTELLRAHKTGDARAAEHKMVALRRAARRVERRLTALQHAVDGPAPPEAEAAKLLDARTALLVGTKRTLAEG